MLGFQVYVQVPDPSEGLSWSSSAPCYPAWKGAYSVCIACTGSVVVIQAFLFGEPLLATSLADTHPFAKLLMGLLMSIQGLLGGKQFVTALGLTEELFLLLAGGQMCLQTPPTGQFPATSLIGAYMLLFPRVELHVSPQCLCGPELPLTQLAHLLSPLGLGHNKWHFFRGSGWWILWRRKYSRGCFPS